MRNLLRGAASSAALIAAGLLGGCQPQSAQPEATGAKNVSGATEKAQLEGLGDLAKVCGFECKVLADGSANISGIRGVDAFFSAVLTLKDQSALLSTKIEGTLNRMALIVGAQPGASIDATAANIAAQIEGGFGGKIEGGITLEYEPPRCSVSAKASVEAAAKCDAKVEPGTVEVECKGECVADAKAMVSCENNATLKCTGTAPSFKCNGSCQGTCELEAEAECTGTCQGTCELDGTAACDGECMGSTDEGGNCTGECNVRAGGKCEGTCKGSCELNAGGNCEGECRGQCEYTAPEGGCEASAQASCEASGEASVSCQGECKGEVEPPKVSAECEATAKAEAEFNAECTPPSIGVDYELAAEFQADGNASAKAELDAQVRAFGKVYAELIAEGARIDGIIAATAALPEAGVKAVSSAATKLSASADIQVAFQAACAVAELEAVPGIVNGARADLQASFDAITTVSGSVGG